MRIISGKHKGRKINPPAKMPHTRPTTDMAKEGLFNIISNNLDITSLKTLDIFAGTGNISFELASRGAEHLVVVEKDPIMCDFIKSNAALLGILNMKTVRMDVFNYLSQCLEKFDLIFADPPYAMPTIDTLPGMIFERKLLNTNGWFILEHTPANDFKKYPFYKTERNYGTTIFSIFIQD